MTLTKLCLVVDKNPVIMRWQEWPRCHVIVRLLLNIWFVSKKNTSFIALIWGFTNFQEMKLICSLFYHRISGRYLANIFFHLTMYGWDSLSSLYTRDIMEIWHIHVSAVLKDYNGTTFIISIRKGKRKKFVPSYFLLILCCEHLQDCWYIKANGPHSSRHQNAWRVGWRGGGPLA